MTYRKIAISVFLTCIAATSIFGCSQTRTTSSDNTTDALSSAASITEQLTPSPYKESDFDSSGDLTLNIEHSVYGSDIDRITYTIYNKSTEQRTYGLEYGLEILIDDVWYCLPEVNHVWNSIMQILESDTSRTEFIHLSSWDFPFEEGQYRLVKEFDEKYYCAEFELGDSPITRATPFEYQDIRNLPPDYSKEEASADNVLIFDIEGNIESNQNALTSFIEKTADDIPAMIRIMRYTIEGDPILYDVTYQRDDQEGFFLYTHDSTRDQFSSLQIDEEIYSNLNIYLDSSNNKNLVLSNYISSDYYPKDFEPTYLLPISSKLAKTSILDMLEVIEQRSKKDDSPFMTSYYQDQKLSACLFENLQSKSPQFGIYVSNSAGSYEELFLVEDKNITALTDISWLDASTFTLWGVSKSEELYSADFDVTTKTYKTEFNKVK